MLRRRLVVPALCAICACVLSAQSSRPGQQPARDTAARPSDTPPAPGGRIAGKVVAADNGRPVKRARAFVSAPELPSGRGTLTDDNGVFELTELPAGRYTLNVSKTGFVALSFGQRRPLQAGTPIQLADGQQITGIEFRLPRGSVIAGHVLDEGGDPMPGAQVRVVRYQYQQGERQLVPVGNAQTDDRGEFRVWGLNPGEYYVSAIARNFDFGQARAAIIGALGARGGQGGFAGRGGGGGRGGAFGGRGGFLDVPADDETQRAYAPTYFPGVASINEAQAITIGVGGEKLDVNFNLLLVRTAHVSGNVTNPDGSIVYSGQVMLMPEGLGVGRGGQLGINYSGRIDWDGKFALANVPPGRYVLRARGTDTDPPEFASQPLTVGDGDVADVSVILQPGASVAGTVRFEGVDGPDLSQVRILAPAADDAAFGPNPNSRVDKEGQFTLDGVSAGLHFIRAGGQLRGWSLRSVLIDGREMVDTPIELRSRQALKNVSVIFTNKQQEINGTVTNQQGQPVTDFTVLAFATDPVFWRPQARQIATARPDQNGKFQIRSLPPGDYYIVTVDPAEQGEWFEPAFLDEHRVGATRLQLGDGDVKTQNFKIATR